MTPREAAKDKIRFYMAQKKGARKRWQEGEISIEQYKKTCLTMNTKIRAIQEVFALVTKETN